MTKSELTEQLASKLNIPFRDAASIIDTILKSMTDAPTQDKSIEIRSFGSFMV